MKCVMNNLAEFNCAAGEDALSSAPSRALQALRSVRSHFQTDGAVQEQRRNFAPYHMVLFTYLHSWETMMCSNCIVHVNIHVYYL